MKRWMDRVEEDLRRAGVFPFRKENIWKTKNDTVRHCRRLENSGGSW